MSRVEDDLREFFATAPLDVPSVVVPVASVVREARVRRRRRASVVAAAITGVAAVAAACTVMVAGLIDGSPGVVDPAGPERRPAPSVEEEITGRPGINDVDHLDVITPTDVGGLAIGMTLAEVEDVAGVEVTMLDSVQQCAARLALGDTVRGYLEEWPDAGGEIVVTSLLYYGTDARTTTNMAVGRRPRDPVPGYYDAAAIDTPLGPGADLSSWSGPSARGPSSVGYRVDGSCEPGIGSDVGSP